MNTRLDKVDVLGLCNSCGGIFIFDLPILRKAEVGGVKCRFYTYGCGKKYMLSRSKS